MTGHREELHRPPKALMTQVGSSTKRIKGKYLHSFFVRPFLGDRNGGRAKYQLKYSSSSLIPHSPIKYISNTWGKIIQFLDLETIFPPVLPNKGWKSTLHRIMQLSCSQLSYSLLPYVYSPPEGWGHFPQLSVDRGQDKCKDQEEYLAHSQFSMFMLCYVMLIIIVMFSRRPSLLHSVGLDIIMSPSYSLTPQYHVLF